LSSRYRPIDRLVESIEERANNVCFELNGGAAKLSKLINEFLAENHMTLAEFARRSKSNDTFFSTFKAGNATGISVKTISKLAKSLGIKPLELAQRIFPSAPMPLAQAEAVEVEAVPVDVREEMAKRGVIFAINGVQMLAEQTSAEAVPAIVEHAGWRMTLIPT
jgi:hypothetical protein